MRTADVEFRLRDFRSLVALKLWVLLSSFANADGLAWPSLDRLMAESGHDRSNVVRGLRQLAAEGWVKVESVGGGRERRTGYRVLTSGPTGTNRGADRLADPNSDHGATVCTGDPGQNGAQRATVVPAGDGGNGGPTATVARAETVTPGRRTVTRGPETVAQGSANSGPTATRREEEEEWKNNEEKEPRGGRAAGPSRPSGKRATRHAGGADLPPVPPALDTPAFRAAWCDWCRHLREKRKPITPTSAAHQLAKLAGWGEPRAVAALQHSTASGWQGVFEPRTDDAGRQRREREKG